MFRAEIRGTVGTGAATAIARSAAQYDKLRQIVAQRPEAVVHPRPNRWMEPVKDVPPGVQLKLCRMIVVGRPHRADYGEVVDRMRQVRPPIADFNAALTALRKPDLP